MLKHILFGKIDSFEELGLILTSSNIEAPALKSNYVKLDGADGSVDFTEAFGRIFYENRKLQFEFTYGGDPDSFADKFSEVQNKLHGRRMEIRISDDEEWWYEGRLTVDKWKSSKAIRKITVEAECDPYKYKNVVRIYSITANPQSVVFKNSRKNASPKITSDVAVSVACNGKSVTLTPNVSATDVLEFTEKSNTLTVTGSTACTLKVECVIGSL